ncbi:MAG TPA: PQQ-binding-like beta-propeller repeat protein [Acidimicrobiales bacterium]|nr:PQQ-binding-like beta-propeller repeat protein [Acidimicrobiales bacterium]
MRRIGVVAGVLALVLGMSGCWLQPRLEPGRANYLSGEPTLTAATVAGLTEVWSVPVGGADTYQVRAPVGLNGRIYAVAKNGRFGGDFGYANSIAVDAATGATVWATEHEMLTLSIPYLLDDPVIHDGAVRAPLTLMVNPFEGSTGGTVGGAVAADLATGAVLAGPDGSAQDFALVDGTIVRKTIEVAVPQGPPFDSAVTAPGFRPTVTGSATVPGDYAFVGGWVAWSDGATGATGYSPQCPESGGVPRATACSPDWTADLGAAPGNPTAVGADQVAYADASGTVSVLDMATGAIVWQSDLGATTLSQPTVTADRILVSTGDGRLAALPRAGCGAATCDPLWTGTVPGAAPGTVLAAGDVAYVATEAGTVAAFDLGGCGAATCDPLVTVSAGSAITGAPIVFEGRIVVGTNGGRLVAFGLPG